MGGKPWTEQEIAQVRQMALLGHSHNAIAAKLGRTRSGIRNILDVERRYSLGRVCSDCPERIRNDNKTGRCKACATAFNNRLPETRLRRIEGWRKRMANPIHYAALCRVAAENSRKAMSDPVKRAAAAERGMEQYRKYLDTPEMRAKLSDPELCKAKGRKITATRLAWCPPEYRSEYLHLINSKRVPAEEARAIIMGDIKAHRQRERAAVESLSPFERQMRALEKGAQLAANDIKPSLANPGIYRAEDAA